MLAREKSDGRVGRTRLVRRMARRRAGAAGKGARSWMFRAAREAAVGMMGRPEMDGGAGWAGRRRGEAPCEKLLVWEFVAGCED